MQKLQKPQQSALSIGSVMIDIITVIADEDIELMTLHNMTSSFLMMEQGRKVDARNIETYVGGGGANTAVCMSRLGLDMDILALVGEDLNGEKVTQRLRDNNISLDHLIVTTDVGSGIGVHISSHDRNAAIFTHRGANCCLEPSHVEQVDFRKFNLIYITNLSNQSADQFPLIVKQAKAANCFIASNPGIRQLTRLCDDFLKSLINIKLLSLNKVECETLIPKLLSEAADLGWSPVSSSENQPRLLKDGFKFGGFSMGLVDCMKNLMQHGPDYVVITDGGQGAYLLHENSLYFCPPQKVKMRGSAGAGDSFSSTLAGLLSAGNNPDISLFAASTNAVSVISYIDTQEGLLTFEDMEQAIKDTDIAAEIMRWEIERK